MEHYAQSCPVGSKMINNKCYQDKDVYAPNVCKNPTDVFMKVTDTSSYSANRAPNSSSSKCVPSSIYKDGSGNSPTFSNIFTNFGLTYCPVNTKFVSRPSSNNFNAYPINLNEYSNIGTWGKLNSGNPHRCAKDSELTDQVCDSKSTLQSNGSCLVNDAKPIPLTCSNGGKLINNECVMDRGDPICPTNSKFDKIQNNCIFDKNSITYSCPDNLGGPVLTYDPKTQMCK